ncbi:hypothetical protein Scep_027813 [Stephania cephalantha]|uniref:Uncharacterized protein n=1 Tax=Stephania cephalantha TaxID=152367 RepID=A0AAP0E8R1_9MAGN
MKYFDCTRSFQRSAFDGNVVYQFEIMEHVSFMVVCRTFELYTNENMIEQQHGTKEVYYLIQ